MEPNTDTQTKNNNNSTGVQTNNNVKPSQETKESKNAAKAAKLLKSHPEVNEVFFTSDGLAFFEKNHADNHARSLKNKGIETIKRK